MQQEQPTNHINASQGRVMLPPKPEAVLFDWDDTLISSRGIYGAVGKRVRETLDRWGLGEDFEQNLRGQPIHYYAKKRFESIMNEDGTRQYSDDQVRSMCQNYFDIFESQLLTEAKNLIDTIDIEDAAALGVERLEGSRRSFEWLHEHNIPFAIISNSPQQLLDYIVPRLFPKLYDGHGSEPVLIGAQRDEFQGKMGEVAYQRAMKELHPSGSSNRQAIWYVGDTIDQDLAFAKKHGLQGMLIGEGDKADWVAIKKDEDDPRHALVQDTFQVDNHLELRALLASAQAQDATLVPRGGRIEV